MRNLAVPAVPAVPIATALSALRACVLDCEPAAVVAGVLIPETGSTEVGLALGRDGQLTVSHAYVSAVVLLRTSAYETNYA